MLACGYVDAIAAHETAILQYMKDNFVEFRILEEPLLVTGLGIAFAKNDSRGLDSQLNAVLAQMRTDGTLEQILGRYLEHASQLFMVGIVFSRVGGHCAQQRSVSARLLILSNRSPPALKSTMIPLLPKRSAAQR